MSQFLSSSRRSSMSSHHSIRSGQCSRQVMSRLATRHSNSHSHRRWFGWSRSLHPCNVWSRSLRLCNAWSHSHVWIHRTTGNASKLLPHSTQASVRRGAALHSNSRICSSKSSRRTIGSGRLACRETSCETRRTSHHLCTIQRLGRTRSRRSHHVEKASYRRHVSMTHLVVPIQGRIRVRI